jgi:hypothetical protein
MFGDEIEGLKRSYPEIEKMYDEKTGKLSIDKKKTGSFLYDYEIVPGSTFAADKADQQENLTQMMSMLIKNPELVQTIDSEGYNLKLGEMFKRIISNSGIQDWDKILEEKTDEEKTQTTVKNNMAQFQQALLQMQGGNMNQIPEEQNVGNPVVAPIENGQPIA